jgi:hypothetical protein
MSRIIGRGRYAGETYPERSASGGGGACAPLSRTYYVDGGTTTPLVQQNGAICTPFAGIQQALDAIPPAIFPITSIEDLLEDVIPWNILIAGGAYNEDLIIPANRAVMLEGIGGPPLPVGIAFPSVILIDVATVTFKDITVGPNDAALFSTIGACAIQNIGFGTLHLTGDGVSKFPPLSALNRSYAGLGGTTAIDEVNIPSPGGPGLLLLKSSIAADTLIPQTGLEIVESNTSDITAFQIVAWISSIGSVQQGAFVGGGHSEIRDSQVSSVRGFVPNILVYDSNVNTLDQATSANITVDAASLEWTRRFGSSPNDNSEFQSLQDQGLSYNAATIFDMGAGPSVTIARNGVNPWTPNTYLASAPLAGSTLQLPPVTTWIGPDSPVGQFSRVLVVKNRGPGVLTLLPDGAELIDGPAGLVASLAVGPFTSYRLIATIPIGGPPNVWEVID